MFSGSIWRARNRAWLAGFATAAGLAVTACGSPATPTQTSAPTSSSSSSAGPAEEDASTAALTAYRGYRNAYGQLALTAEYKNVEDLRRFTADPALGDAIFDLSQMNKSGLVRTGVPVSAPSVASVNVEKNPHSALLSDCLDRTGVDTVSKATGVSAEVPGQAKRVRLSVKVAQYDDGRWLVQSIAVEPGATC